MSGKGRRSMAKELAAVRPCTKPWTESTRKGAGSMGRLRNEPIPADDQQVTMESAFAGPAKIAARMGSLDVRRIAEADPDEFVALCATPPAVHRYPGSMAGRIQGVARAVLDSYDGDVTRLWTDGDPDGATVLRRLKALPGFGDQKARIFLALLGK